MLPADGHALAFAKVPGERGQLGWGPVGSDFLPRRHEACPEPPAGAGRRCPGRGVGPPAPREPQRVGAGLAPGIAQALPGPLPYGTLLRALWGVAFPSAFEDIGSRGKVLENGKSMTWAQICLTPEPCWFMSSTCHRL